MDKYYINKASILMKVNGEIIGEQKSHDYSTLKEIISGKKMYLRKNEQDDEWYFSLIPFEELENEDNVISYPRLNNDLDNIYVELNIKDYQS